LFTLNFILLPLTTIAQIPPDVFNRRKTVGSFYRQRNKAKGRNWIQLTEPTAVKTFNSSSLT